MRDSVHLASYCHHERHDRHFFPASWSESPLLSSLPRDFYQRFPFFFQLSADTLNHLLSFLPVAVSQFLFPPPRRRTSSLFSLLPSTLSLLRPPSSTSRVPYSLDPDRHSNQRTDKWVCHLGHPNWLKHFRCQVCDARRPPRISVGDWTCPRCHPSNVPRRLMRFVCRYLRDNPDMPSPLPPILSILLFLPSLPRLSHGRRTTHAGIAVIARRWSGWAGRNASPRHALGDNPTFPSSPTCVLPACSVRGLLAWRRWHFGVGTRASSPVGPVHSGPSYRTPRTGGSNILLFFSFLRTLPRTPSVASLVAPTHRRRHPHARILKP